MAGIDRHDIGFTVSGSCDYLAGQAFAFVQTIEAIGAWPPISESHVEMDGAWAMYEGWTRLQEGDIDLVLVFGHGRRRRASPGRCGRCSSTRTTSRRSGSTRRRSPRCRRARCSTPGVATERDFAEVVARNRGNAVGNQYAQVSGQLRRRRAARRAVRAEPAPASRPPADLRRRGRGGARRR